ncbi:hypothetical protein [Streptomyces sp. AA1529]|uniref:hypothetical protein n=1 Tax=Streptomyces sp. AA1529 TaxID=1203257 RepID=UPI0002FBF6BD|nr:hypothetical protein [Streptomyces sp. AA1529]
MATDSASGGDGATCPGCGGGDTRPVSEARTGKGALRKELGTRLAKGPEKTGDGCMHFLEGMVLTGMGAALAWTGMDQDKPLQLGGGILLAAVCFAGTIVVVRGDRQEQDAESAGAARADALWAPARYCYGCESVFCPGGEPWPGVLTPEEFRTHVWTEAGYADQLPRHAPRGGARGGRHRGTG